MQFRSICKENLWYFRPNPETVELNRHSSHFEPFRIVRAPLPCTYVRATQDKELQNLLLNRE